MLNLLDWNKYEDYKNRGFNFICGVDEAGRGPLAGPVYAAACVLPNNFFLEGLNDSKKLSPKKREQFYEIITEKALFYAIEFATVEEIDRLNILNASMLAMRRAVESLMISPFNLAVLVDGNTVKGFDGWYAEPIVRGDTTCPQIAAASVLAKVSRDKLCAELDAQYPQYGFLRHKGYGTKAHMDAIREFGVSEVHRKSFMKFLSKEQEQLSEETSHDDVSSLTTPPNI